VESYFKRDIPLAPMPANPDWSYNSLMDDQSFRRRADASLESLKERLYVAEGDGNFEVDENAGALEISFDEPPAKFVISPNAPVRQIWISALSTSFKLDWSDEKSDFVLPRSGEPLKDLVSRLITEQLGGQATTIQ
jgi:iron donor protein CyaY